MKVTSATFLALVVAVVALMSVSAQTAVPSNNDVSPEKPPVQVVGHKIDRDYYPMLDRPSSTAPQMTADVQGLPPVESDQISRQRTKSARGPIGPVAREETRSRGILSTYLRVIEDAQIVRAEFRNTSDKPVKSIEWDFAFPRYENGVLLSRFDVTSPLEIKAGGRKSIKYKLPAGAKKCEVVKVMKTDDGQQVSTFEAVCGEGFNDPQLEGQKQETISIKRITFSDGTAWVAKQ